MAEENDFIQKCELCGSHHDVFDVTGCFSKSAENILKENPHHFDKLIIHN